MSLFRLRENWKYFVKKGILINNCKDSELKTGQGLKELNDNMVKYYFVFFTNSDYHVARDCYVNLFVVPFWVSWEFQIFILPSEYLHLICSLGLSLSHPSFSVCNCVIFCMYLRKVIYSRAIVPHPRGNSFQRWASGMLGVIGQLTNLTVWVAWRIFHSIFCIYR